MSIGYNGTMDVLSKEIELKSSGRLLEFKYPLDVYNPSLPFVSNGEMMIAGRAEERQGNISKCVFFRRNGDVCLPVPNAPIFPLEDPFISQIQGRLVFGGVEVNRETGVYRTMFYMGTNIYDLSLLTAGPPGMKDIRLVELIDNKIGIFTRPQGKIGGLGKIGFTTINDLRECNERIIRNAPLIEDQFGPNRWGGVNQGLLLADGTIGIIGHVARFEPDEKKHYMAMAFEFNPQTRMSTEMRIIARRESFPKTDTKRSDLEDIVFPSGLVIGKDKSIELLAGLSDVAVGCLPIKWPFNQTALNKN